MRISFHLGAAATDNELLIRSLLANTGLLLDRGIIAPRPGQIRKRLSHLMRVHAAAPAPAAAQAAFLRALTRRDKVEGIIFSYDGALGAPSRVLAHGELYGRAGPRTAALRNIFPDADWSFHLAIRNPATFLPEVFYNQFEEGLEGFMAGVDPRRIRWSGVVGAILDANPGVPLTVWCNEDSPIVWPEILQTVSGIGNSAPMEGGLDMIATIITPEGLEALRAHLLQSPPALADDLYAAMSAALAEHGIEDAVEQDVELPGWTPELVDEMTATYEDDLDRIALMPGVQLIEP